MPGLIGKRGVAMLREPVRRLAVGWATVALLAVASLRGAHPVKAATEPATATGFSQSAGLDAWQMPFPEDWELQQEGGLSYLHMKRSREPGTPRRPIQFALLKEVDAGSFTLDVMVRRVQGSMIVVFGYVDTLHFYYVHLSKDSGSEEPVHNGIFLVDGAPRRRIAGVEAKRALPDRAWHHVKIVRDVPSGSIQVFVDKETTSRFSVVDHTFTHGQVGVGSFDETGDFARFRLQVRP
jgi:hypothetical protein